MQHGGDLSEAMAHHGGTPSDWLDLSTGINPHPYPLPSSLPNAAWRRLPAREDIDALLAAARGAYRVPEGAGLVAAPGTQALIGWLPVLAPPGAVAVVAPTYEEHAAAWRRAGAAVSAVASPGDLPADARHLVVVNPNNPDGRVAGPGALRASAEAVAGRGGWLVLDESFADVAPEVTGTALCARWPVVVLRSFGKFYGLAGLRLGFAIAEPALAGRIGAALGPWAVSGPALHVGRAALADRPWAAAMRARLRAEAAALDSVLATAGLEVTGGTILYRLARHPRAAALHEELARALIWVRRFPERPDLLRFGLPPDPAALSRLAEALARATPDLG